jgi:hypothetical protein
MKVVEPSSRFRVLIEHDARDKRFAFVAWKTGIHPRSGRGMLFRIMR